MLRTTTLLGLGLMALAGLASGAAADSPPPPPPPIAWDDVPPAEEEIFVVPESVPVRADEPPAPPAPPTGDDIRRATETGPDIVIVETIPVVPPCPPPPPPCAPLPGCDPCPPPCAPLCPDPCDPCRKKWSLTLEGTWTFLTDPEGPFGEESGFPDQLYWDTLDYDGEFGARGAISYANRADSRIEVRFAWLGSFQDERRQTGVFGYSPASPAPPIVPGLVPGVTATNTADFESEADLYTGELNWWSQVKCACDSKLETCLGARFLVFDEEASATNWATAFSPGFPAGPFVRSEVENLFIGAQAGVLYSHRCSSRLTGTIGVKGMLGYLSRDVSVSDRSIFSGGTHSSSNDEELLAWGLEAELGLRLCLTDWLAITGGYSFLFLDDVARAHDTMNFGLSTSGAVQAQQAADQLFAHTFFAGISLSF